MEGHVKALGIVHIIFAAIGILVGLLFLVFFGGLAAFVSTVDGSSDAAIGAGVLGIIGTALFGMLALFALPGLIIGIGLVMMQSWARIAGIILSGLELLNFPFGTFLGIYGLWVLLKPETEMLMEGRRAAARA
jgi:hypothetical protein